MEIVPVEPFNAKAIALAAQKLTADGIEWELDDLEIPKAVEVCLWLEQLGVVPFGTAAHLGQPG